jgi:hypothetical protein
MVCRIDLIDDVETIENFKRMQRDQWAEYRGPFRYLYIWDRQAAFSCKDPSKNNLNTLSGFLTFRV